MSDLRSTAALACALVGVVLALAVTARTRDPRTGLAVLLDLLLAAGLLRLSTAAGWSALLLAALVVAVRQVVRVGLTTGASAGSLRPASGTASPSS